MFFWSSTLQAQTLSTQVAGDFTWAYYVVPLILLSLLFLYQLKRARLKHPPTIPPDQLDPSKLQNVEHISVSTKVEKSTLPAGFQPAEAPPKSPSEIEEILADNQASWMTRLRDGLSRTRNQLSGSLNTLFGARKVFNEELLEEIHENLYRSDMGVETADRMIAALRKKFAGQETIPSWELVSAAMRDEIVAIFEGSNRPLNKPVAGPTVILVVGVNGVGKTTSIGKLAARFVSEGKSVLLCAGDTFRAAAIEQLSIWGERLNVPVIKHQQGADPASVAFDGVKAAKARGVDILLIDTAGRLHSKVELMDELSKIKRVIQKELPEAPHETWLVIDSTNGQNAVQQVKAFGELISLSGLIVTKLDGTAKGGVIVGIHEKFKVPIRYIGVGEKAADLKEFSPKDYAESLFS